VSYRFRRVSLLVESPPPRALFFFFFFLRVFFFFFPPPQLEERVGAVPLSFFFFLFLSREKGPLSQDKARGRFLRWLFGRVFFLFFSLTFCSRRDRPFLSFLPSRDIRRRYCGRCRSCFFSPPPLSPLAGESDPLFRAGPRPFLFFFRLSWEYYETLPR